jgi:hypothetical protein
MGHSARRIYIGSAHPTDLKPSYMGDSIGHWEGSTLVSETVAIKSIPGEKLIDCWTKLKNGSLTLQETTIGADGKPTGPASTVALIWRPDITFVEDICEGDAEAFGAGYGGTPKAGAKQ